MSIELKIPEVGESIQEVQIGRWLKKEGDRVEQDEDVVQLETDKASLELPAPSGGVLGEILEQEGAFVSVGDVIARIEPDGQGDSSQGDSSQGDSGKSGRKGKQTRKKEEGKKASDKESKRSKAKRDESEKSGSKKTKSERRAKKKNKDESRKGASRDGRKESREVAEKETESENAKTRRNERNRERPKRKRPGKEEEASKAERKTENGKAREARRADSGDVPATPSARRALRQYGLSADEVEAEGDRLRPEDVRRHVERTRAGEGSTEVTAESREPPGPRDDSREFASSEDEQVVPMSMIRRSIARRLVDAQRDAALLTTFNEIDMTEVMRLRRAHRDSFRKKYGIDLGYMSFFVKAAVDALGHHPVINAEIRGDDIVYHKMFDVGIAIGTDKGLVVPVLRRAERMSFAEIEEAIEAFARRAEANELEPDDLSGGTFTITNGGVYGSLLSTPIVNPPQSGVLGMHAIQERPVAREGQVVVRPMMYVALTYDHRIADGREAVSFLRRVKETIEQPARMLIEA